MLKYKITNQDVVSSLYNIKYEVVSHSDNFYVLQTMPFEVDYKLKDGDNIVIQGFQDDGNMFQLNTVIIIDETLSGKQFKINEFEDVKIELFNIIENKYEDNGKTKSEVVFNFNESCYLDVNDIIQVRMNVSYQSLNGNGIETVNIPVRVIRVNSNSSVVIGLDGNEYNGLSEEFIINLLIKPDNLSYLSVYRKNNNFFRTKPDGTLIKPLIFKKKNDYVIGIKLNNDFNTNIYQTEEVTRKFVYVETEKAINPAVNLEKNVYVPAYIPSKKTLNTQLRGQDLPLIESIEFNLHFRERDTSPENKNKWLVKQFGYWNGYKLSGTKLVPSDGSYGNSQIVTFSSPANQSDLLSYLNFNDDDVRFQKSKLKKSFLRLLFYDSRDTANQRLLYYSTIFIDSGSLLSKYARYNDDNTIYWVANSSNNVVTIKNVTGLTSNGEYSVLGNSDDVKEGHRLSSRFVVKDKYNASSSSEGFYLYLFSEDSTKLRPRDIYMRVEFNHAGYGRTIPFMMPVKSSADGKYQEPIDISDSSFPYNGYRLSEYYKNLYIHLKCVYDDVNKRYVYYVPRPLQPLSDNGLTKMVFNLYEVKIQ